MVMVYRILGFATALKISKGSLYRSSLFVCFHNAANGDGDTAAEQYTDF